MKKILSLLSLATLTLGMLGSCSKINERLDNLDKRVDGIENEKIAAISDQITNINSSIADLGTIRKNIQDLTATTAAQALDIKDLQNEDTEIGKKISDLKKADESINARIDDLQKYVNDTLKAYGTKEWVEATFSTLAQYEATCDTIAKIDARLGSMDARLSKSIEDCVDSLKSWVNVQLDGYYTIAEMDAKVAEMKSALDTVSAESAAKADSLKAEIAATKAEIDTVKANIRTEYKSAIETAITALDGKLSNELQTAIAQVNLQISNLTTRINNLQTDVTTLTGRVTALEDMIQSVVIVPAYNDGSVRVDNDSLYIDCIITPATVVERLDTANVVILVNKVKTKASAGVDTVKIESGDIFEKDITNGSLSIRVNIANKIPSSDNSTITVALNIKNGKSDFTTDFAPIYVKPLPAGALKGKFTVNAQGKKVHFSQGNLVATIDATGAPTAWKFATHQYDYIGSATANTSIGSTAGDVDFFGWSTDAASNNWGIHTKTYTTTGYTDGNFKDWGKNIGDGNTWRTLSNDEWTYLFDTRTVNGGSGAGKSYSLNITYGGKMGVVLYPDGYSGSALTSGTNYTDDTFPAGCVFLPAAGYREGSTLYKVGASGYYWSSTAISSGMAYHVLFYSNEYGSNVDPDTNNPRFYGYSVRLITDVK